ncbi:MAG: bacillithiol biosynthesis cysteine-adding enzyme BshC [Paraglaciecola sp.]|jgi:bacillithiol biosynthesis cysteine-adding enzyme BshC
MEILHIPFEDVPQLSSRDKAYYREDPTLQPFYKYPVNLASFKNVIADKATENINREVIVEVLKEQYSRLDIAGKVEENIGKIADKSTFTVITAHQPSLFTGPLYYIYKIISAINLAKQLNAEYGENQFIPVFVTGGEDHDFEEANHANLFGKKLAWESGETGSVGKMKTAKIQSVLEELKGVLKGSENAQHIFKIMNDAYTENELYAEATIQMVHELFKNEGLVVLNMSHPKLKRAFIPIIKEEILKQPSIALVEETVAELEKVGFSGQATPREINFFYLDDQIRERIVFENGSYQVLNTDLTFSEKEMVAEIDNHPEKFSPNVVMRPIFEEAVLPNLAYIGGGGELAYWLERKTQFEHFGINFPMLIRRNSALWVDKGNAKKIDKLGFSVGAMFQGEHELIKQFVNENATAELSLEAEKEALKAVFEQVAEKTEPIEPTLVKAVFAEQAKQLKSLENLESKIMRAEKQKHDVALNQIAGLKDKLYPNNDGLQERTDNFMGFYLKYGEAFFETLKANLDPLKKGFVVVVDSE